MTKLIKYLNLIILLLAALTANAETTRCTPITELPFTITKEGVFCLKKNLGTDITSGNAITILRDNVTLDLNGWKLGGQAAGKATTARGIYAHQRKNITIRNGTIRGFYAAIFLNDENPYTTSQNHLIEGIRADHNTRYGIRAFGSDIIVRRNQVVDIGGSTVTDNAPYGIQFVGPGGRLLDNDISTVAARRGSVPASGVHLTFGDGVVVEGNRIQTVIGSGGFSSSGVYIIHSDDTLVVGNRITNVDYGIHYTVTTGKYMGNLTSDVGTPFSGGTDAGGNN